MALSVCRACTTAYAPAAACPHCGADDYFEEGSMPKITVHGGPSNKALYVDAPVVTGAVVVEADAVVDVEPEPEVVEPEVVAEPAPVSRYDAWLLVELRDECTRRGLPKTGNKDELVARLVESDPVEPAAAEEPHED